MDDGPYQRKDWIGLTVECRRCHDFFTIESTMSVCVLVRGPGRRASVGVACPQCAERLIVQYDHRWRTAPAVQPPVLPSL
jgi:hypothetical protein